MTNPTEVPEPAGSGNVASTSRVASGLVAAGILFSRLSGLIREGFFSSYFGTTLYADVFRAGLRMPNVLQNLLGEGTLSASFIPVYSELLEQGKKEEAGRTAGAILGLLMAAAGALALTGIALAPFLVSLLLPGFEGERRSLSIEVVRIVFPMTGILVISAWALGILNSHRKFFVSYVAPVFWNIAIIATLVFFGGSLSLDRLVIAAAWGALVGGVLQFAVQLPWVLRLERNLRPSLNHRLEPVREAIRNAGPAILGRGVVQLSGYVDFILASLLAAGAVSAIGYAQTLYVLPVSLFGMSVAAAELPELARQRMGAVDVLQTRTNGALERIAFFVIPSFVAFLTLGDLIVAMLYQRGEFDSGDTLVVYLVLVAFSIGLVASTSTRLFSSTFYALRDTRSPARFAIIRVVTGATLGFLLMNQFEPIPELGLSAGVFSGIRINDQQLGAVGLALGSGIAAWIEWALLKRKLKEKIGGVSAGAGKVLRMLGAALAGAAAGWGIRLLLEGLHPIPLGIAVFAAFGTVYLVLGILFGLGEARAFWKKIKGTVAGFS